MPDAEPWELLGTLSPGKRGPWVFFQVRQKLWFSPCPLVPQAFAGFYYTFHFLNLTQQQSLSDVNTTILAFCRRNWAEVRAL